MLCQSHLLGQGKPFVYYAPHLVIMLSSSYHILVLLKVISFLNISAWHAKEFSGNLSSNHVGLAYSEAPNKVKSEIASMKSNPQKKAPTDFLSGSCVIIYASRTHSQLSQVIGELKHSGYSINMTVMGSREQLCVNDKIARQVHILIFYFVLILYIICN